jgi:hypothetical protein
VTLPYRSRNYANEFADGPSYRAANCRATNDTNGYNAYAGASSNDKPDDITNTSIKRLARAAGKNQGSSRRIAVNKALDVTPRSDAAFPPALTPPPGLDGSSGVVEFHYLSESKTGVLALGSFESDNFDDFQAQLLTGLQNLVSLGAAKLSEYHIANMQRRD